MNKIEYHVQFELNASGEKYKETLPSQAITRVCDEVNVLGVPGQSVELSFHKDEQDEPNIARLKVSVLATPDFNEFESVSIQRNMSKFAALFGKEGKINGWSYYPPGIAYSDDPQGDYIPLDMTLDKDGDVEYLSLIDDPKLKLYVKSLLAIYQKDKADDNPLRLLSKMGALGTSEEEKKLKAFFSGSNFNNEKVSRTEVRNILETAGDIELDDALLQRQLFHPSLVNLDGIDESLDKVFINALSNYIDDLSCETASVLCWCLNNDVFVKDNAEELKVDFNDNCLSHALHLYSTIPIEKPQSMLDAIDSLEELESINNHSPCLLP